MKKSSFIFIFILALSCFTGCASDSKQSDDTKTPQGSYKIAFLGDSLTDKGVYPEIVKTHYTEYIYTTTALSFPLYRT